MVTIYPLERAGEFVYKGKVVWMAKCGGETTRHVTVDHRKTMPPLDQIHRQVRDLIVFPGYLTVEKIVAGLIFEGSNGTCI